ncbi:glutathione S-transferase family protein [Pseudomonas sp. N040]|uniref:glutathione S-transferase family protein n=1 Tax=Pseudomonas sp. N040 TaxID=2785325 RepID=UPI0018A27BE3|nr:glutathione S-transferase family protein [Pseudomonas sp. N040]MBF7730484.1 glutathione S-transferase family protein [Pseudomonas sp. N040]MBW7014127.1 glutathione S-transferase family protein [Pseudomonas sp. N040]
MHKPFVHYGWHLSYFSGKTRCYLTYKGIPFEDNQVNLYNLMVRNKRKTGVVVMPILRTPENEWLHDTSLIIDRLEARFPQAPVIPQTPLQRSVAYLLEAWGDEWWIPIAMHTRWSYPENYALWEQDAGPALLPHFPKFLQRRIAAFPAGKMRVMLHAVGVRPEQAQLMNDWTANMLDHLDRHFAEHPYLLGGHPTLADFGLVGSMYGHLGRDPWPARELVAPRRHLRAWIDRMASPPAPGTAQQPLLADDRIADTLLPVLHSVFSEFVPMLEAILAQVNRLLPTYPAGKPLPRSLGEIEIPMAGQTFRRNALPYSLWMAQRVLDGYRNLPPAQQDTVGNWLREHGGSRLLELDLPRLRMAGLRVALEAQ